MKRLEAMELLIFILSSIFYFFIELEYQNGSLITVLANTILDVGFLFVLLLLGSHYLELIQSISKKKLNRVYYAILAVLSYLEVILYDKQIILSSTTLSVMFFIIVYLWYKNGALFGNVIVNMIPLKDKDKDLFIFNNPPTRRSDLILLDIIILFVVFMPTILKLIR